MEKKNPETVSFQLDDKTVHTVNKAALVARSKFFAAMFNDKYLWYKEMKLKSQGIFAQRLFASPLLTFLKEQPANNTGVASKPLLSLSEVPTEVFATVVQFVQKGRLPTLELEDCWNLRTWSHYFGMESLESAVEQRIAAKLDAATVCVVWNDAEKKQAHTLSKLCQEFVQDNFSSVCDQINFVILPKPLLKRALHSGRITSDSSTVFGAVLLWGKVQAMKAGRGQEEVASMIDELLPPSVLFNAEMKECILQGGRKLPNFMLR